MKNIILIPVADLEIDPRLVFTTFEGTDTPVIFQFVRMAGSREFNNKTLILTASLGDIAQAVVDSSLDWTVLNTGLSITGANALDWIADIQDFDGNGDPVGAPYRPITVPPLTKWLGDQDWSIV